MNTLTGYLRQAGTALRFLLLATVVLGLAYPLAIFGIGQLIAPYQANGSILKADGGAPAASALIAQASADDTGTQDPQWFHARPSAVDGTRRRPRPPTSDPTIPSSSTPSPPTGRRCGRRRHQRSRGPRGRRHGQRLGPGPGHLPGYARLQVPRVAAAHGLEHRNRPGPRGPAHQQRAGGVPGPALRQRHGPEPGRGRRSRSGGAMTGCSKWKNDAHGTWNAADLPGGRTRGRQDLRNARGSAPAGQARRGRRRRVRHGPRPRRHPRAAGRARSHPAPAPAVPGHGVRRDGPGRRAGPRPRHRRSWTNTRTPTFPAAATPNAGRTSRNCSTPASTSCPPSTSSTWHPWATSSAPSPMSGRPKPCPTTSSAGPTRSTWWTSPRNCCASAWATEKSTPRTRSTPPCPTTSGWATSPPCANWPCSGSPTGSMKAWPGTGPRTTSRPPGRPANGSSSG